MSTGEKRMLLVPTNQLRWFAYIAKSEEEVPIQAFAFRTSKGIKVSVLQQKFLDREVCKEDGTMANEYWIDIPVVIDDEKKMD